LINRKNILDNKLRRCCHFASMASALVIVGADDV